MWMIGATGGFKYNLDPTVYPNWTYQGLTLIGGDTAIVAMDTDGSRWFAIGADNGGIPRSYYLASDIAGPWIAYPITIIYTPVRYAYSNTKNVYMARPTIRVFRGSDNIPVFTINGYNSRKYDDSGYDWGPGILYSYDLETWNLQQRHPESGLYDREYYITSRQIVQSLNANAAPYYDRQFLLNTLGGNWVQFPIEWRVGSFIYDENKIPTRWHSIPNTYEYNAEYRIHTCQIPGVYDPTDPYIEIWPLPNIGGSTIPLGIGSYFEYSPTPFLEPALFSSANFYIVMMREVPYTSPGSTFYTRNYYTFHMAEIFYLTTRTLSNSSYKTLWSDVIEIDELYIGFHRYKKNIVMIDRRYNNGNPTTTITIAS